MKPGVLGVKERRVAPFLAAVALALLLLAVPAYAAYPGKNGKIAFVSSAGIETIMPDGSDRRLLTDGMTPAWSPDGSKIAFRRCGSGVPCGIYVANADGTGATRIVAGSRYEHPTWSPDQTKIAFIEIARCFTDGCLTNRLWTANADGTGLTLLVAGTPSPVNALWSPDGTWIAFKSRSAPPYGFDERTYLVRPDGSETRALGSYFGDIPLSWAPDASRILVYGPEGGLGTIRPDGTAEARLPGWTAGQPANQASYSPDGSKIVVAYDPGCSFACFDVDLYVMNADGSGQVNITNTPGAYEIEPDWEAIPGPQRSDYKNASQFCKAERDFLGDEAFSEKYGTNGNGANAYGKCVSQNH